MYKFKSEKLRKDHLLYHFTKDIAYVPIDRYAGSVFMIDDSGDKVLVSRTCLKKYFKEDI